MPEYYVDIVRTIDGKAIRRMGPFPADRADRIASGAEINLDHDSYWISIWDADEETPREVRKCLIT